MIECLIIGDSIAVGLFGVRPECHMSAMVGISSVGWDSRFGKIDLSAKTVIISLGSNDWDRTDTYGSLREIRSKVKAKQVFWVAPNQEMKPKQYYDVNVIAGMYGDKVVWTDRYEPDRIHPNRAGYKELAEKTRNVK